MTNEVAKSVFGGKVAVADLKSMAQSAAVASQNTTRASAPGGSDYMNFSGKRGLYSIGQDKRSVSDDELWLVDVSSFEEGWVCWKGGSTSAKRLANIYKGVPVQAPDPEEGGPFDSKRGDGWFQAKAFVLRSLHNGQQGYLTLNSISGVSEMADLIGDFADRAGSGMPAWPVIRLEMEEFESQGYKNFKPIFAVEEWLDDEQIAILSEAINDDDFDADDWLESVATGSTTKKEPEPKAEPAKVKRRQRSRAK